MPKPLEGKVKCVRKREKRERRERKREKESEQEGKDYERIEEEEVNHQEICKMSASMIGLHGGREDQKLVHLIL